MRVHRWLGEIQLEGRRFWMDDFCEYGDERQYVHYRFRRISRNGNGTDFEDSPPITVSYAMFDLREASAWLKDAGFDEESIELQLPLGWSYVIVSARRSR